MLILWYENAIFFYKYGRFSTLAGQQVLPELTVIHGAFNSIL